MSNYPSYLGRKVLQQHTFDVKGTFAALYAVEKWIKENGYSMGSSCALCPTAILKGDFHIAKWKNLTAKERKQVDGVIIGDTREGPVHVLLFNV